MANYTISPNMSLLVPIVGIDPGPEFAYDVNSSLTLIDGHDHSPGHGVAVSPSGLNINSDLSFLNNNATQLRTVRFAPQLSLPAVSPDLGALFVIGSDLYYNDEVGNQVRITQGGSVAGATGTITGLPSGTASAAYSSSSGTFVFQQATSTAANMDIGTLILRYPGSYPSPAGNFISIQAPTSLTGGYAFTLPGTTPAVANALLTSDTSGNISYTNADNTTIQITAGVISVNTSGLSGITGSQLAANTVTTNQIAGGTIVSGNVNSNFITFGSYTPTLSNQVNLAALTFNGCQYFRVGNTVTISGAFVITTSGMSGFQMSLPIFFNNFTQSYQAGGGVNSRGDSGYISSGCISGVPGTPRVIVNLFANNPSVLSDTYSFNYTYLVV